MSVVRSTPTELCNAKLYLADDEGDNYCTLTCQLALGHKGYHLESFRRTSPPGYNEVVITWTLDETPPEYDGERISEMLEDILT